MPRAIVLVIDGLGAKHLGPYGNTWIETPAFNQLATESLLVDGLYAPSFVRNEAYSAWWSMPGSEKESASEDWLTQLGNNGIHTQLLTDEPQLLDHRLAAKFAQQDHVEPPKGLALANEWDETHFASFFAQAIQFIDDGPKNSLLWLHSRGFWNPWDAPYEFRKQFAAEDDPDPSGSAQVPSLELEEDFDPDTLHEIQCAFGGQVSLLDQCIAVLLAAVRDHGDDGSLLLTTSNGGFPLGEHYLVGMENRPSFYHEALSVPAMIRYPNGQMGMKRRSGLIEFPQITDAVSMWLLERGSVTELEQRDYSISQSGNGILLRTRFSSVIFNELTANRDDDIESAELYLKPDDQNEVNDVSDSCDAVVELARDFLVDWKEASHLERSTKKVPDLLLEPLE